VRQFPRSNGEEKFGVWLAMDGVGMAFYLVLDLSLDGACAQQLSAQNGPMDAQHPISVSRLGSR
jgi:hypothetical protein